MRSRGSPVVRATRGLRSQRDRSDSREREPDARRSQRAHRMPGPSTAPKIAAPNAVPITSPRRELGAVMEIHASAPAQVAVLAIPWTNRAPPSASALFAAANAKLDTERRRSPAMTARFGPNRAAARPPGMPPRSAPAPYAPTRSPAPAFERWNSSAYFGMRRRQRREQQRVDEDDRADEKEEAAHVRERTRAKKIHRAGCVLVRPSD